MLSHLYMKIRVAVYTLRNCRLSVVGIMARERVLDDIVTGFMLNTCRLRPQPSNHGVIAALLYGQIARYDSDDGEVVPLITGSAAEFYIEPMLPLVNDVDVMYHLNTQLVIPEGHPPPTQLPDEFRSRVDVYQINNSQINSEIINVPGYVYLKARYLLRECSDYGNYKAVECHGTDKYIGNSALRNTNPREIHGPAAYFTTENVKIPSRDEVPCLRCLLWPLQAADWPTRHRNYGWPDSGTLVRVVSNGCDVVAVAHRQCRQHKWMSKVQWRLSFSRAEIVLINRWMPVQQIVYHMLRYFRKIERVTDCADNSRKSTLSNYHIKTLMLWACELKPNSWWTDDVNLVKMCVQLLHILAELLTDARCQHYFIHRHRSSVNFGRGKTFLPENYV